MRLYKNAFQTQQAPVGVIAITEMDTQLGLQRLASQQLTGLGFCIAQGQQAMSHVQTKSEGQLTQQVLNALARLQYYKIQSCIIYCNTLSSAIDLKKIRKTYAHPIVTPLDVYAKVANAHQKVAILGSNCQITAQIEKTLLQRNPKLQVIGVGYQHMVQDLLQQKPTADIISTHQLVALCEHFVKLEATLLISACTHFEKMIAELEPLIPKLKILQPEQELMRLSLQKPV
jgi:glutamate racemase